MKTRQLLPAMLAFAALNFAACNNDENPTNFNDQVAAIISGSITNGTDNTDLVNAPQTRASATAWAEGDLIGISASSPAGITAYTNIRYSAMNVAGNFEVANASGEDNTIYFQDKKDVNFTAYYPHSGTNGTKPGTDGIISHTITIDDQMADRQPAIDFLWAQATANAANPQVQFRFAHTMSSIRLSFIEGDGVTFPAEGVTCTLAGLKLDGTFDTSDGTATASSTAQTADLGPAVATVPTGSTSFRTSLIVWPQQVAGVMLTVNVSGITTPFTAPLTFTDIAITGTSELLTGKSYTFNVKVEKTRIDVSQATITDWSEEWSSGNDTTVYPE